VNYGWKSEMEKDYKNHVIFLRFLINEITGFGGYRLDYIAFAATTIPNE
jgi:hypothetical protein